MLQCHPLGFGMRRWEAFRTSFLEVYQDVRPCSEYLQLQKARLESIRAAREQRCQEIAKQRIVNQLAKLRRQHAHTSRKANAQALREKKARWREVKRKMQYELTCPMHEILGKPNETPRA
eukprot:gb/GFBE01070162.1/.p1 GENE.gb/GFBE01070162.1/~~gb/GFBE01070162.1/.p1  ORF type:complete len:120 (+),score=9.58 gb/GFBE01070162.1/:1-360(+)